MMDEFEELKRRLERQRRNLMDRFNQQIMEHARRCLDNMNREAERGNLSEAMIQGMYAKFYIDLAGKN